MPASVDGAPLVERLLRAYTEHPEMLQVPPMQQDYLDAHLQLHDAMKISAPAVQAYYQQVVQRVARMDGGEGLAQVLTNAALALLLRHAAAPGGGSYRAAADILYEPLQVVVPLAEPMS